MAVSSGFFNSQNHDRLYNAEQVSSIFDGIITDGVYDGFGDSFNVTPNNDTANTVFVDSGRAWFNHTWTLNDARIMVTLDQPDPMNPRIDAIVIDVDRRSDYRKNSIISVTGPNTTSSGVDPQPPTLIHEDRHDQYAIAYVTRPAGDDGIVASQDIEMKIGTEVCPRVIGILEALNDDQYWQQLEADFNVWWDGIKDLIQGDTEDSLIGLANRMDDLEKMVEESTINEKGEIGNYQVLFTKLMTKAIINGTTGNTGDMKSNTISLSLKDDMQVGKLILPDGYVANLSAVFPTTYNNKGLYFITTVFSPDGVAVTNTNSAVLLNENNGTTQFYIADGYNADSYPVTIGVCTVCGYSSQTGQSGNITDRGRNYVHNGTVTITEDHVVNYNITSNTYDSQVLANETSVTSPYSNTRVFLTKNGCMEDGSRVFVVSNQYDSDNDTHTGDNTATCFMAFKLSPDGTLQKGANYTKDAQYSCIGSSQLYCTPSSSTVNAVNTSGDVTQWFVVDLNTLSFTSKTTAKPSVPGTYVTFKEGSFSTLNMNTKKYNTQTWNRTNQVVKSSSDFEHSVFLMYDRGQSFSNQDSFYKVVEMDDGTLDYILYGTTGIDHFLLNPLTSIAVVENKLNTSGFTNFTSAATNKYCHRRIGSTEYYLVDSTLYRL